MKTSIIWAELHSPIFLAGTNLGQKLDPTKRTGLAMNYDEDKRHMYVTYNSCTARVPEPSILSMVEGVVESEEIVRERVKAATAKIPAKAQVSTPMDHVFAGVGAGKTKS